MSRQPLPPWTVLESRQVFRDRWIDLRADRCRTGAGAIIDPYYVVHRHDWGCVLAVDDAEQAVCVRVWRHGIRAESFEIPAGAIDADDASPAEAVRRELLEETGYTCGEMLPVAKLANNPANHNNYVHVFAARGARRVATPKLEAGETLVTELLPLADLLAAARAGHVIHAVQTAAILLAGDVLGAHKRIS